jgi:hypothetical protein
MVAPTDGTLILATSKPDHQVYSVWGLSPLRSYPTGRYPNSVALGDRERVAVGVDDLYGHDPDLYVYEAGASQPTWTYDFGLRDNGTQYQTLAPHGLGWAAGNDRLYAVTTRADRTAPVLHTLIPSTYSATSLSLAYTGEPYIGDPVGHVAELGGALTTATGDQPGAQPLHVVRHDALGDTQLPDVVTTADGGYTFSDTIRTTGLVTYTVRFDGTGDLGASESSLSFDLSSP